METTDFVLLTYSAFDNKISGKTMLQKKVYFTGVFSGIIDKLQYKPHYYGPYSSEVDYANNELKSFGYIEETTSSWGISPSGFENIKYDFKLTDIGKIIAEKKQNEFSEEWNKIKKAAKIIDSAGDINYISLSVAAKAYYILTNRKEKMSIREIRDIAKKFGWNLQENELTNAIKFLEKTELASRVLQSK
jgi:uncharacterized protein